MIALMERSELLAAALAAADAATAELLAAALAGPDAIGCKGCSCVRVLITYGGLVCALCGAKA